MAANWVLVAGCLPGHHVLDAVWGRARRHRSRTANKTRKIWVTCVYSESLCFFINLVIFLINVRCLLRSALCFEWQSAVSFPSGRRRAPRAATDPDRVCRNISRNGVCRTLWRVWPRPTPRPAESPETKPMSSNSSVRQWPTPRETGGCRGGPGCVSLGPPTNYGTTGREALAWRFFEDASHGGPPGTRSRSLGRGSIPFQRCRRLLAPGSVAARAWTAPTTERPSRNRSLQSGRGEAIMYKRNNNNHNHYYSCLTPIIMITIIIMIQKQ